MDPASLEVLLSRLAGIAQQMGVVLRRASFSPNIKERADCSSAIFAPDGELLAQAEHIPVHLGSMPASVAAVLAQFGDSCRPGDQFIVNDPFAGGTHLNDVTLVAPCFSVPSSTVPSNPDPPSNTDPPQLLGWVANRAHHADLGGGAPGSMPADATEIFQEGLRLPPLSFTPEVAALIEANSRTPTERRGDIDAQLGANISGAARLAELCATMSQENAANPSGAADPSASFSQVLAYGERLMRANLSSLPDGTWHFQDVLDSFGPEPHQQQPRSISLTLSIAADEITFDFTGTDSQVAGSANAVRAVTESCVAFALRTATDPQIPANGGATRPVKLITEPGSLVDARPPAAVGAGNVELSQRIADVCLGALAQIVPEKVGAASAGTMNNILIGGQGLGDGQMQVDGQKSSGDQNPGGDRSWVYYETVAAGQGARPNKDGMSGVHTCMTNTQNTPIEALERAFPMRVECLKIRQGSGGAGQHRGGDGIQRDIAILEPAVVSLITERRQSQPWGLAGGEPGATGENWLVPRDNPSAPVKLPDKVTLRTRAGDIIRMLTPGGGGWGPGGGRGPKPKGAVARRDRG